MADDNQYKSTTPLDQLMLEQFCLLDTKAEGASQRLKELADPSYRRNHNIVSLKMESYVGTFLLELPTTIKDLGLVANDMFRVYVTNGGLGVEIIVKLSCKDPQNGEIKLTREYVLLDDILKYKVTYKSMKTLKLPEEQ